MHKPPRPSVCVVVPVLNEARYIREAIESLLVQEYEPLEVTVYDGGSTDGTLDILKEFSIEVIVEPGLGQAAAINRGWQRTTADFVAWIGGDDFYRPDAIRCLAETLHTHPEAGFVYADTEVVTGTGKLIARVAPGEITLRDLVAEFCMMSQSALIRRTALFRAGMMDEERRFAADWDLFLRLAQYYPMRYVHMTAAVRRLHRDCEDMKHPVAVGEAGMDVIRSFFQRPDLMPEQRAMRSYGLAGSRLAAGWHLCIAGERRRGWRMLFEAMLAAPRMVCSPRGVRLLGRLMLPFSYPPPWDRAG